MSWLDDLLGKAIKFSGQLLPQRKVLNIIGSASVSVADNPGTGETDLTIDPGVPAADTVTTAMIQNLAITTGKLADGAVTTAKIFDGSVTDAKLDDDAVTEAKILDGAVTTDKIADFNITPSKLDNDAVENNAIADDAVTATKIRLANNTSLRARNAANSADVDLLRLSTGDLIDFQIAPLIGSTSSSETVASAGAISVVTVRSNLTGAGTYTLAAGTQGQFKIVANNVGAGTSIDITATGITFVLGSSGLALLWFTGSTWALIGGRRATSTEAFAAAGTWGGLSTHVRCTGTTYTVSMPVTGSGQQVMVENAASGNVTFGGQVMATGTRYLYVYLDGGWRRTALT